MNKLKYWCYKILPLVYDDSLSYYEVLCKFRDKLNEVIESIDDIPGLVQEYLETDEFRAFIAQLVDSLERGFVNVDNYGAVGDGVTNDYQAFVDAFEVGNELGIPVVASGTKTYAINATSPIIVRTDANFNGAKIKVLMTTGDIMFYIYQQPQTKTINQGGLSYNKVYDSDLFNKVLHVLSPLSLGLRNGFGTPMYHEQMLVTDGAGHFTNAVYFPEIINGDYVITYWDVNFKHLTFENMVFETTDAYGCNHIRCNRNNTTIQNIGFVGNSSFVGNGFTSMIWVSHGYNVTVRNVVGEQAWPAENTGYLVGYAQATDCVTENVRAQWRRGDPIHGDFGNSGATNMTYRNCNCFRFDCHYEMMGYWHIYDCSFLSGHVCGGWGTFTMENCVFPYDWNSGQSFPIDRRNDLCMPYSGTITFKNITMEGGAGVLNYTMSGYLDEATNTRPPLANIDKLNFKETVVVLDNIVMGPKTARWNFMQVNDNLTWPAGTADEDRYEYHTTIIVKNMNFWRLPEELAPADEYGSPQCVGWGRIKKYIFENCVFNSYLTLDMAAMDVDIINCKLRNDIYFKGDQKMYGDLRIINCEFAKISGLLNNVGSYHKKIVLIGNTVKTDQNIATQIGSNFSNRIIANNVIVADTKTYQDAWNSGVV